MTFGDVALGGSAAETVVITNVGAIPSPALEVAVTGTVSASFAIDATTCSGALESGESCTVSVSFRPTSVGAASAFLNVANLTLGLGGTGVDAPVLADDAFTVEEDAAATELDVLANDGDGAEAFVITAVSQPTNGVAAIATGGKAVTYAPAADFCSEPPGNAPDSFTYTVAGLTATVAVTVNCVDDPAVASDDTATATEGGPSAPIDVLANDVDVDSALRIASVTQPPEGTVTLDTDGGGLNYQPAEYPTASEDVFTYTLHGGSTATVTVAITMTTTGCERPTAADLCVHGECSDGGGSVVTCDCDEGWQGDRCNTDINECLEGLASCDDNAECINGAGTYRCQCVAGFEGDGTVCVDVDECLSDICGDGAACTNTVGSYTCACAPGYSDEDMPGSCVDIDECADNNGGCNGQGVSCVNGEGGFDCAYTGCGDTCPIPTFCSAHADNICPFPTTCSNPSDPTNGFCACTAEGFEEGPGGGCFDIDECQRGTAGRVAYATCHNREPGFEWICNVEGSRIADWGWTQLCVDVDECSEGLLTCESPNAECDNRSPGAVCVCKAGYVLAAGSLSDATAECVDVDECAESLACDVNATCVNTDGAFECVCPEGTFADGFSCNALVESADDCDPLATFVAEAPAHCECLEGFVGDGTHCVLDTRSTGLDGAFEPTEDVDLSRLVYHFSTIHIPEGVTLEGPPPGWLELRATGDVVIDGTIDMRGQKAVDALCNATTGNPSGRTSTYIYDVPGVGRANARTSGTGFSSSGPGGKYGGGCGGKKGLYTTTTPGGGGGYAGGGSGYIAGYSEIGLDGTGEPGGGPDGGAPGQGGAGPAPYAGGAGSWENNSGWQGAGGGGIGADAAADLAVARTFRPGSAGGGGGWGFDIRSKNVSGAGGGGAIRIISATRIVINGLVTARGGDAGRGKSEIRGFFPVSGAGSGGVIYLSAPEIVVNGTLVATGGNSVSGASGGGLGRIRLSVDPARCTVDGATIEPPLEDGCAASPAGGTPGMTYVGAWPE